MRAHIIPNSLDIMPFSFVSPPYYLQEYAAEVYLSPMNAPLSLCDSDERKEG